MIFRQDFGGIRTIFYVQLRKENYTVTTFDEIQSKREKENAEIREEDEEYNTNDNCHQSNFTALTSKCKVCFFLVCACVRIRD